MLPCRALALLPFFLLIIIATPLPELLPIVNSTGHQPLTWLQVVSAGINSIQHEAPSEQAALIQIASPFYTSQSSMESELSNPRTLTLQFRIKNPDYSHAVLRLIGGHFSPTALQRYPPASLQNVLPVPWPPQIELEDALELLRRKGYAWDFERVMMGWRTKAWGAWDRVDMPYWCFRWGTKVGKVVLVGMDGKVWEEKGSYEDEVDVEADSPFSDAAVARP